MATSSQFNRGYGGGLAANARPSSGLAGGSQQGGGFRPSFQGGFMAPPMGAPAAPKPAMQEPFRPLAGMDYGAPPATPQQQAPDMNNFFGPAPLPAPGATQNFNKQPPSPFGGPEPLPALGAQTFDKQPPSPFGGFRAEGGPVAPGQAYVVGERGPEVIVPQMPGMVIPNQSAIRQSPMNRSQDPNTWDMAKKTNRESFGNYAIAPGNEWGKSDWQNLQDSSFGSNSLANREARPVGRSANDITRIAERMRRQGDPRAIMQLGMMDKQQGFMRERDATNFQQGQQMWQQNQQAMDARDQTQRGWQQQDYQRNQTEQQKQDEARRQWDITQYGIKLGDQALEQERQRQQAEMDRQRVPNVNVIPYGGTGYGATVVDGRALGNVPMNQAPAAPSFITVPGTNNRMLMQGNERVPGVPMFEATPNPGWSVKGQPKETLAPIGNNAAPKPVPFKKADGTTEYREWDAQQGGWKPSKFLDANNDGIPDNQQGGGGNDYFNSLTKTAAQAPAAPATAMVTGQMPNVAYANDMNPDQQLAVARDEYARTGNDAKLREHFKNFPSQAVQYGQKEVQLWQQIGQMPTDTRQQIEQSMTKMREADRLNAQGQAAAKGMPIPANYAVDPDRRPLLPPQRPYVAPQEDPFLVQSWQGAQSFAQDATAAIKRGGKSLADYAKKHPLYVVNK